VWGRWAVFLEGLAIACLIATGAWSAQPKGRAVETEAIVAPAEEPGLGSPEFEPAELEDGEDADPAADDETFEANPSERDFVEPADLPEVQYDTSKLPPPVRRLREQIIDAATTGDIEKLREVFEANDGAPAIYSNESGDPIDQLLALSGDPEGREILAILIEVLDAGFVHVDVGTPEEMYIWPYFARYPLESLDGRQMVELFKILTAGDYEDMKIYGVYLFYRVGIDPKGVWRYFLAGD
jgi:hypothetical protein